MSKFKDFYITIKDCYITKNALTEGIIKSKVGISQCGKFGYGFDITKCSGIFEINIDCFEDRLDAIKAAEKMRKKVQTEIMKELARIESIDFNKVD